MNKSSYFKMIASAVAGLRRESGSIAVNSARHHIFGEHCRDSFGYAPDRH